MVIRGRTRGNGRQLGDYLLAEAENDNVQILDVEGRLSFTSKQLKETLLSMSLTSELTRSDKGLYHAQINPAYGEDELTPEKWFQAADILAGELGLQDQRRVIVLHSKKGRTHAHVVWERFDHEKRKMVSDSFSRLAQDRARQAMEQVFEMKKTPVRNQRRPEMKESLSDLWKKCKTGGEFVQRAKALGYTIAAGVQRRPFMVVDITARSFDLVRQLIGVKTKEVKEKLRGEKLPLEKVAIEQARKILANDNDKIRGKACAFADNRNDMFAKQEKAKSKLETIAGMFAEAREELLASLKTKRDQKLSQVKHNLDRDR